MSTYYAKRPMILFLAVFSFALFSSEINAQVEKQVVFAKGKYSATHRGNLPRSYSDRDKYYFRAKRGQILSIRLTTNDPEAFVSVFEIGEQLDPDKDQITVGEDEYPRIWSGKLPVTSEFMLQIHGVRSSDESSTRAPYTIEITIR